MMPGSRYILAACLLVALLATGFACWPAGVGPLSNSQAKDMDLGGLQNIETQLDPHDVRAARSFVDNTIGETDQNTAEITGLVRDKNGRNLDAVEVLAVTEDEAGRARTKSNTLGAFRLGVPSATRLTLAFAREGYRPEEVDVCAPASGVEIILERSPTVHGRVLRVDGSAVNGALVYWRSQRTEGGAATTGRDGSFSFSGLPRAIHLYVEAPNCIPTYRYLATRWDDPELIITVDTGRTASGTVLEHGTNTPIADALVSLWVYRSTFDRSGRRHGLAQRLDAAISETDGSFALRMLPSVGPEDAGARTDFWTWTTCPGRASRWQMIERPHATDQIRIGLFPEGSVRGRVVSPSGAPLAGKRVIAESLLQPLCDAGDNRAFRMQDVGGHFSAWSTRRPEPWVPMHKEREAFTDSDGYYLIERVPAGGETTLALPGGASTTVSIKEGEMVVANDIVEPRDTLATWTGTVLDERDAPVSGAIVRIGSERTLTAATGAFELCIPIDPHPDHVRAEAPGYIPTKRHLQQDDIRYLDIRLTSGHDLRVQVVDRHHAPVPDASVRVYAGGDERLEGLESGGARPPALRRGLSDDRGLALLRGVPDYCDVVVRHVRIGGRHEVVRSADARSGLVRVVLEDVDMSAGIHDVIIRVMDGRTRENFEGDVSIYASSTTSSIRVDGSGPEVRLDQVPRGNWDLRVSSEGFRTVSTRLHVQGNTRTTVALGEGSVVSGRVAAAGDIPVKAVQVTAREISSDSVSVTSTDELGRFEFVGLGEEEYSFEIEPMYHPEGPLNGVQRFRSTSPVTVDLQRESASRSISIPVVPISTINVVVGAAPDMRSDAFAGTWTRTLEFEVLDHDGNIHYAGGPTDLLRNAAELLVVVPPGRFEVLVRWSGRLIGRKHVKSGESWRLETP